MAKKREKNKEKGEIGAFILIRVLPHKERGIYEKLEKMKKVILVNELFGEWDIIIGVDISNAKELDTFVSEKIRKMKEIGLTSTMIVAR
ncbi:MAG: Lrp/AsnC ligand binding domain-containing protein [Candidatus Pacearchaeota archaeon]|nr:MAG: Lrp/AsnC ligand binding domain-containing protein [Candidatus Pacearchaeota archaeon]